MKAAANGQGTFVYDQQSSTDESMFGAVYSIQDGVLQSFTPGFSNIDFVKLNMNDANVFNGTGATVYVNLRAGGISGPILSSTDPVFMANGFMGPTNFLFPTTVPLTPGDLYFLEPMVQTGDHWRIVAGELNYPGGSAYYQGVQTGVDLWFREGIIIPEPSARTLITVGAVAWGLIRRKARRLPVPKSRGGA